MNIRPNDLIVSQAGVSAVRSLNILRGTLSGTMMAVDVMAIVALSCIIGVGYHLLVYRSAGDITAFIEIGVVAACTFSVMSLARGDYAASNVFAIRSSISHVVYLWNLAFVAMLVLAFVTKTAEYYSRGSMLLLYGLALPVLIGLRLAIAKFVERASRSGRISLRRVFMLGAEKDILEFLRHSDSDRNGLSVVGCHFLASEAGSAGAQDDLLANIDVAVEKVRFLAPDAIIMMLPWSDNELIDLCVDRLMCLPTEIHLGPDRILRKFSDTKLSRLGGFVSLRLTRVPLSQIQMILKRVFDLIVASLALTILMPVLLVVAALIKLDSPGPVLFFQRRYGFNRRPFRIVKFRTMVASDDGGDIVQAVPTDTRFTRLGRWLRRLNVDEIPQLFNVVMGDMSLVGPRPHAVVHDEIYGKAIATYARRHKVKPGMTGWAQINGFRGETENKEKMEKRIQYDLYYIENCSLVLDVWILLQTVFSSKAFRNAY